MLFNSLGFIFCFLPVTLAGYYLFLGSHLKQAPLVWLTAASFVFYAWWNPAYLLLLGGSILFNYKTGTLLGRSPGSKPLLWMGISGNLALLGYFKYANFFVHTVNQIFSSQILLNQVILPIGISFFTFQQIAFIADAYRGRVKTHSWYHYSLFVAFFPQLIAGPIVHHSQMLPQFIRLKPQTQWTQNLSVGLTLFFVGLFKKAIIADGIASHATPVFTAAELGARLTFFEAWLGALAYTFQLYFDFSGYSEMAIGLAMMFGIALPLNFRSPYKAINIADFWQRWHITLSGFLKQYLYIPMGGNRQGRLRRYRNLMVTMLLGGLWHGAGWQFILWGGLHGLYLCIYHFYRTARQKFNFKPPAPALSGYAGVVLTFACVVIAWVLFRAQSLDGAIGMYKGMIGLNGFSFPSQLGFLVEPLTHLFPDIHFSDQGFGSFGKVRDVVKIFALFFVVWAAPSTFEMFPLPDPDRPDLPAAPQKKMAYLCWTPNLVWATTITLVALYSILSLTRVSEFLYFQF